MLTSLSFIFLVGLSFAAICEKIRLPKIIGMIAGGILLGPYVFNLLDPAILNISSELRQMALIIILIKAGLSLDLSDLKKVGRPAVLLSFVPASFEILGYVLFAPRLLGISYVDAAVMGAVLGAVSPAVVVPRMLKFMAEGRGTEKRIPQMIMAGASCDDIFVIVLFTTFSSMAKGQKINPLLFVNIPVSVLLGVALGAVFGLCLGLYFERPFARGRLICSSERVLVLLSLSFLLLAIEAFVKPWVAVSGLLAVVSMACVLKMKSTDAAIKCLSEKFGNLWIAAEVILFVLVGAAVDIRYTLSAGPAAVGLIFIALGFRSVGVAACLFKTSLCFKERIFCMIAYLPKATVQAAIGALPLSMGLSCGSAVLSVAVLGILITAPLGALGIDLSYRKLL